MRGEEEEEMEEEEEEEGGISGAGGWWQGEVKVVVGVLVVLLVVVCFGEPDGSHFSVFRPKRSLGFLCGVFRLYLYSYSLLTRGISNARLFASSVHPSP